MSGLLISKSAVGKFHSLTLDSEGKIYAWGLNGSGQLGNYSIANPIIPVQVNFE